MRIKFRQLGEVIRLRSAIADRYHQLFEDTGLVAQDQLVLPTTDPNAYHVWNQFGIRIGQGRRDALRSYLADKGIGSEIYYPVPMHRQECFSSLSVDPATLPETERASSEILNLPIFPTLTESEQQAVVNGIVSFYRAGAKIAA